MEQTFQLLLALIKYTLFDIPLSLSELPPLTEDCLEKLYQLSDKHDLAHLVGDALYKNHLLPKDSPAAAKFQKAQVMALYRYTRMEHERTRIYEVLENAKIPFVPLKGLVIRPLYPQPHLRTSCDLDILIHREDLSKAIALLESSLRYTSEEISDLHDISLFSPSGIHLELHYSLETPYDFLNGTLAKVWEYCTPVSEGTCEYRQSSEFFMLHQVTHMVSHFLDGGCGIRPLADLSLLQNKFSYDEATLIALCQTCESAVFYEQAKLLAEVWFAEKTHTETTREMERFILGGGVYGSSQNNMEVRQHKHKSNAGYIMSRIFMPYGQLKQQYPILKKHKWLFPFISVRRWFNLLIPKRRKRALGELAVSAEHFENAQGCVSRLLSDLGLP